MFDSFDYLTVFSPFCQSVVIHTLGTCALMDTAHLKHASSENTFDTLQFTSRMLTC